jgi:hypothetical protein
MALRFTTSLLSENSRIKPVFYGPRDTTSTPPALAEIANLPMPNSYLPSSCYLLIVPSVYSSLLAGSNQNLGHTWLYLRWSSLP